MTEKLLRLESVKELTGKSRSSIYADMDKGLFPKQVSIGARSVAWPASAVSKWVEERISLASTSRGLFGTLRPSRSSYAVSALDI